MVARSSRVPIRIRLMLWQVGVFAFIVGGLGALLVTSERATLETNAQEGLELTSRVVIDRLVDQHSDLSTILGTSTIPGEAGVPEVVGQVVAADGSVVEDSASGGDASLVSTAMIATAARDGHWHARVRLPGRPTDDMVIVVRIDEGPHAGDFLVLAQTLRAVDDTVTRLAWLVLLATPVAVGLAAAGAWWAGRAALRPVDELTRRAAAVDATTRADPLPVPAANDEIARLAVTLNTMLDRLRRALEAERRLAADASHELRTPIGVMEAELDVALRSPRTPPEAKAVLRSVRDESAALGRIVANLLALSRAEATGEVGLDRQDTDLLDLAYTAAARLRPIADRRGVALTVDGTPAAVIADPTLLTQAVANLVANALEHTPAGGSVEVRVTDGDAPRVTVRDTGTGIPADELPHIFDRFYRVDRARRRDRGGAGLGLEITRRIVEAHGGRIEVESESGRGSTFTLVVGADDRTHPRPAGGADGGVRRPVET